MLWQQLQAGIKNNLARQPIHLQNFSLIRVAGLDAADFLNRQFTQDLSSLPMGQAIWSAYCSAKGRVMACFWVFRATNDLFYLMLPKEQSSWFQKRLMMFVLRAKVKIELADDVVLSGGWQDQNQASPDVKKGLLFSLPHSLDERFVLITPKNSVETQRTEIEPDAQTQMAWALADWRAGLSWIDEFNREQLTPHDMSLDQVGGASFNKGCYPGQEIVARMHYLGRAKQRLSLWIGSNKSFAHLKTGVDVCFPEVDQPIGTVVNSLITQSLQTQHVCVSLSSSGFVQWQVGQSQCFKLGDDVDNDFECVAIFD